VSDQRDARSLEYIRECIALIERDVRSDPSALDDIHRSTARSIMWSMFTLSDATTSSPTR